MHPPRSSFQILCHINYNLSKSSFLLGCSRVKLVRVGHPARLLPQVLESALDAQVMLSTAIWSIKNFRMSFYGCANSACDSNLLQYIDSLFDSTICTCSTCSSCSFRFFTPFICFLSFHLHFFVKFC